MAYSARGRNGIRADCCYGSARPETVRHLLLLHEFSCIWIFIQLVKLIRFEYELVKKYLKKKRDGSFVLMCIVGPVVYFMCPGSWFLGPHDSNRSGHIFLHCWPVGNREREREQRHDINSPSCSLCTVAKTENTKAGFFLKFQPNKILFFSKKTTIRYIFWLYKI